MFRGCYRASRDICGCFVLAKTCFLFRLVFNAFSLFRRMLPLIFNPFASKCVLRLSSITKRGLLRALRLLFFISILI